MAERANPSGKPVRGDPATIRAAMAQTRADLTRAVRALKEHLFGAPSTARPRGRKPMATKKAQKSSPASKKKSGTKKGHSGQSKGGRTAKKVMTKMLAGAAVGAVKGAAEAVAPKRAQPGQEGQ
jgi:hypothetical protein